MTEVLNSACADTSVSQLSALLSLHRKLLVSIEERPKSMLKGVEDSLNSLSKVPAPAPPPHDLWVLSNSLDGGHDIGAIIAFALNVL